MLVRLNGRQVLFSNHESSFHLCILLDLCISETVLKFKELSVLSFNFPSFADSKLINICSFSLFSKSYSAAESQSVYFGIGQALWSVDAKIKFPALLLT